jgi:signal transduction histidine kinase
VYLLDEEEQGLTLVAQRNLPDEITECADGLKSARMLAHYEGLKHQLAMPLRSEDKVTGLLAIGSPEPCPSFQREVKLMNTICNEIGMVIKNARLLQDVDRQLQIERCMCEVVEEITTELELDKVLPKVMQIAQELVGADGGIVALRDEKRNAIIYPYLHNLPRELAEVTVSEGEGLSGEVMATGRLITVDDYQTYAKAVPEFVQAGLVSVVAVPIVSGVRTFGALSLFTFSEADHSFDGDLAILAGIGRQAGIAIENAYLYDNMRFYARRITRAQENERRRIARELHDDTIQSLVGLSRQLEALAASYEQRPETTPQRIEDIHESVDNMIQRVRRFSQDLRPSTLDDLGLLPTLEELIADLNRVGLQAELRVVGGRRRLPSEVELTFFRIAQEALNNVMKHAQATQVVTTVELSDSAIRMTIQDNGKGFKPPTPINHLAAMGKLGVIGMYERVRLVGGTLSVQSEPGQGTTVIVKAPI